MIVSLSPFAPENLVARDGFSRPVPRQPAHSSHPGSVWCLLTGSFPSSRFHRPRPSIPSIAIGSVSSLGAPICNIVLQQFYCNMVNAIRTTPQETLFGSLLLLWFLALVLAGCCQLVCFEFGVLRCPCIAETGRLENMYREEKNTLRRPGHVAPRGLFLNANS